MRFLYQYRTSENELKSGEISASSRDAAFAALKERGIKPSKVEEAPGLANKLFGKGKRWLAIAVLCASCIVLVLSLYDARSTVDEARLYEERAQLYGDPVVIGECEDSLWTNVFTSAFNARLAQYAVPGKKPLPEGVIAIVLPEEGEDPLALVDIEEKDLAEVAQMKRMVNGIKRELSEYLKAGGTILGYIKRLEIRQKAERGVYETAQRQILRAKDHAVWKEKNAELRAMGLPMVELPEE